MRASFLRAMLAGKAGMAGTFETALGVRGRARARRTIDAATAVAQVEFRNPERARLNMERVLERVPAAVARTLPPLLAESPDPDSALNLFDRFAESADDHVLRLLARHPFLIHYAIVVFSYSQYLGETLLQNPDLFQTFSRTGALDRAPSQEELAERLAGVQANAANDDVSLALARFKRREYVHILLRDALQIATLADTAGEISALADVLIEQALRHAGESMRARYGYPQFRDAHGELKEMPFVALSLGKLGGNELNYNSDVDLMFLFGDGDESGSASLSHREYFVRLAQQTTEILSRMTSEGPVFRIDLRLRPRGSEGEPAISLSQALRYYADSAADWELQALIKARHSAGDRELAREFIRRVQPFIYREELNFAAIDTALKTRERMLQRRKRPINSAQAAQIDLKFDRGGIRDIEFLVQCLQRVYGGAELWLRSGGTLFSLQKLHDKGHISGKEFHDLTTSYELFRKLEHRLQLRRGQQLYRLPPVPEDRRIIYRSMGNLESKERRMSTVLRQKMAAVGEIYDRVIHQQQWQRREALEPAFEATVEAARDQSWAQILQRLQIDSPELYRVATRPDLDASARRNLHRFLSAALTSTERYAAVVRAAAAVERALPVFATSDYLTDLLLRHPQEISTISQIGKASSSPTETEEADDLAFGRLASGRVPQGEKMGLLRQRYRRRVFGAGARDVLYPRSVYDSFADSTAAAEEAIRGAFLIAGEPSGFAVMALGRLGTCEFDVLSDADLLFVRDEAADSQLTMRAAEQIVEALAAYTRDGSVFPVDVRLRPHGAQGELVVTSWQLAAYFRDEAMPWEALTYTKMRFVLGNQQIGSRALEAVRQLNARFSTNPEFLVAVREMRARLEAQKSTPGERNFKTAAGGFYDIDFIASALSVRGGEVIAGNTRKRLACLEQRRMLGREEHKVLDSAAELLRTLEHVMRLVVGRARKSLPVSEHARTVVERMVAKILGRELASGLEAELAQTMGRVREVYERVLT